MDHNIVLVKPAGPPHDPREHWPEALRRAYDENRFNGAVGNRLVSETARCRVWHLHLPPGGFLTFHRHVLPYFWSATAAGIARGFYEDGRIQDVHHYPGETRHYHYGPGEYMVHAIENVGETDLEFVTVEFLDGDNPPLAVPDSVRLSLPAVGDV